MIDSQYVKAQRYAEHIFDYSDYGDYEIETDIFGRKIFATAAPKNVFRQKTHDNVIKIILDNGE